MDRTAEARWEGTLKDGGGRLRLGSGAFEGRYSFTSRFESGAGTNPEELLGAAHAGCFSMALASALAKAGFHPKSVDTKAIVHLGKVNDAFAVTGIDLETRGEVPGISMDDFQKFAEDTKKNCIISRALASVAMTVKATLAS